MAWADQAVLNAVWSVGPVEGVFASRSAAVQEGACDQTRLCPILMDNRHGLGTEVKITHASGTAERQAVLDMLKCPKRKRPRLTVGADKGCDCQAFVQAYRKLGIPAHRAAKIKHSAIDGCSTRYEGYEKGLVVRKRIEEALG